jgi:hypothetical protein
VSAAISISGDGSTVIAFALSSVFMTTTMVPGLTGIPLGSATPKEMVLAPLAEMFTKLEDPFHSTSDEPEVTSCTPPLRKKGSTFLIIVFFVKIVKE